MGKGVQQAVGLEFLFACGNQIWAGIAESLGNLFWQVHAHRNMGGIGLPVVEVGRIVILGMSHDQPPASLETRGFRGFIKEDP